MQNKARREGRFTQELLDFYLLEGFLVRLVQSGLDEKFVLKGGSLIPAYGPRRPTRDVDLLAQDLGNDAEAMLAIMIQVASNDHEDGLEFDTASASAEVIRDDDEYQGVRISMKARLATAELVFHIDVSVGDPVYPAPQIVTLPLLLGGELQLRGYPIEMVYAEKIVTALARGTANTRWRDFADIYRLSGYQPIDAAEFKASVARVGEYRAVTLVSLRSTLEGFATIGQIRWAAWVRKKGLGESLPTDFESILEGVFSFADPVLTAESPSGKWDPMSRTWF